MTLRVAVIGVSASGKSTLQENLRRRGIDAHALPQEHSVVRDLPARCGYHLVVVLDAEMATIRRRRSVGWGDERLRVERARLRVPKARAILCLKTDGLTSEQVADAAEAAVRKWEVRQDRSRS